MIKYVCFDFDGTLVDSAALVVQMINDFAGKYGYAPVNEEKLKSLRGISIKERCRRMGIPLYKLPQIGVALNQGYSQFLSSLKLIDGMKEAVYGLKGAGLSLTILSSNSERNIEQFLAGQKIDVFDHVFSSNNLFGKHHALNKIIRKLGIQKDQLIYVGDERRDIDSCKKAGVKIAAVSWGYDLPELLAQGNPDYMVDRPAELADLILGMSKG